MSIPTGADYHICAAKSKLADIESMWTSVPRDYGRKIDGLCEVLEQIIMSLELIQREREKEKE